MTKAIYFIATCTAKTDNGLTSFAFNGYLDGMKLKSLIAKGSKLTFYENKSYIVHLKNIEIKEGILIGDVIKRKILQ